MTLQRHQRQHRSILMKVKQIIDLLLWLSLKRGFSGYQHGFRGFVGQSTLFFKGFSVLFTLLLKISFLLLSYPLSYTWLKGEPQVSRKEIFFPRYLQYGVLGDRIPFLEKTFIEYQLYFDSLRIFYELICTKSVKTYM